MAIKNIGIDIREATPHATGKGRVALELTQALIASSPESTRFHLFTKVRNPLFPESSRVQQIVISGKGPLWHWKVARHLKKQTLDFFLATTSYLTPAFAPKRQKVALLVHDLVAFLRPQDNAFFPTLLEKLFLKKALQKSQLIATVSKNTWLDLSNFFPFVAAKKHLVIYPGVSEHFYPEKKKTLELPDEFCLAVGTLQPRKNLQLLFKVFPEVAKEHPRLHLCIVGGQGWKSSRVFQDFPKRLSKRIHFLGYLNDPQLREVYSRAKLFVFPSFYEGFGIPPLEAMACACPVISSNSSSLPEVVGNAGLLIDPKEPDQLKNAIHALDDAELRDNLKKRGLKRAKQFSWEKGAKDLLRIFS